MTQVTLGGDRLGSGKKNKVSMRNYERSTHDLSYVWRSTMASGTLVPFMSQLALPGDTFDIDLNCDVLTHPTIGPLFGTYKVQLDVFQVPLRLYQAQLHMNALNIGRNMGEVRLPQIEMEAGGIKLGEVVDNQQINPSALFSYLGIRGLGYRDNQVTTTVEREFNAVPYLAYWDIYKNYYANKQEELGVVIHNDVTQSEPVFTGATWVDAITGNLTIDVSTPTYYGYQEFRKEDYVVINTTGLVSNYDAQNGVKFVIQNMGITGPINEYPAYKMFKNIVVDELAQTIYMSDPTDLIWGQIISIGLAYPTPLMPDMDLVPRLETFLLSNIDDMRMDILRHPPTTAYKVKVGSISPYGWPLKKDGARYSKQFTQEGLGVKTYNSDLFNNWIDTEWIDGVDGISEVSAVVVSGGQFTIDELNLSKKIYDMLNRIAISGGTYDDWLDATYTHERTRTAENPMYVGGLMKTLSFQEVVNSSGTKDQPLGTLAGRGKLSNKSKGGKIIAKIDEPSYLIGIISLTPNIDYSQGNQWDNNLITMDDLHKPALDEIGFQDLITDQMAWWDTGSAAGFPQYKSAGKQPAWINYMTNVNVVRGNFADQNQQMFMTLNRRYVPTFDPDSGVKIKDLTTYIDPVKFNHIFADTRRDAQNFWVQIGLNIEARRKMSAKVIPNL